MGSLAELEVKSQFTEHPRPSPGQTRRICSVWYSIKHISSRADGPGFKHYLCHFSATGLWLTSLSSLHLYSHLWNGGKIIFWQCCCEVERKINGDKFKTWRAINMRYLKKCISIITEIARPSKRDQRKSRSTRLFGAFETGTPSSKNWGSRFVFLKTTNTWVCDFSLPFERKIQHVYIMYCFIFYSQYILGIFFSRSVHEEQPHFYFPESFCSTELLS